MKFQFAANINDQDYINFNDFCMVKSYYGKKQMKSIRILFIALFVALWLFSLFSGDFTKESFFGIIPSAILCVLVQVFLPKIFMGLNKMHIKNLKRGGKMPYSPSSVMEFYDDYFVESTPENKTQQKYVAVERISVVEGKTIYIHINKLMAYILPISCFNSKEQFESFVEFTKTKCENVDIY